jgi:endoglucanase
MAATCPSPPSGPAWLDWEDFKLALLTSDGRIADPRDGRFDTVSEAQAYGLFFALVANDRLAFDALLAWTEGELCDGDLAANLPAWHWGRDGSGQWRVLDRNAASDADLWIAYTLAQAGRLWQRPRLTEKAGQLASLIVNKEVVASSPQHYLLLPGPFGFADATGQLRLNPSYLPLPLLRWFAAYAAEPVWPGLLGGTLDFLHSSAPWGLAPDWQIVRRPYAVRSARASPAPRMATSERLPALSQDHKHGSYDAIRVYLWLGLTSPQDPDLATLLRRYARMCDAVEHLGQPPLSVDPARPLAGQLLRPGPRGFAAALMPFARTLGRTRCVDVLRERLNHEPTKPGSYYDAALNLFAQGFVDERYRFAADGSLWTAWSACIASELTSQPER